MKLTSYTFRALCVAITGAILCGSFITTQQSQASGGATDPIPGTSKSSIKSGGGGGGGGTSTNSNKPKVGTTIPAPAPAPAPATQPIVSATLTFTAAAQVNGVVPQYSGNYQIDPYYPTLSLMTVNVQASYVNVPDNTVLYIAATGVGGTVYPFTNYPIVINGGAGSGSCSAYVTPGTTLQGVVITDASGNVIATGN
jgi:hypothetical protein